MYYARMKVSKTVFDAREKSVHLEGIFGSIYLPKSKLLDVKEVESGAVVPHVEFLAPCWVFSNKDFNPCQFDEYIEHVKLSERR